MNQIKKLKCWLFGHQPYFLEFKPHECHRCKVDLINYNELTNPGFFSRVQNNSLNWKIIDYFKKCDDCGLRFFKHDNEVPHIPF